MDSMLIWLNNPKQEEELVAAFHPLYKCEMAFPKAYLSQLEEKRPRYLIISSQIAQSLDLKTMKFGGTLVIIGTTFDVPTSAHVVFQPTIDALKIYIYTEDAASTPYEEEEEELVKPEIPAHPTECNPIEEKKSIEEKEVTQAVESVESTEDTSAKKGKLNVPAESSESKQTTEHVHIQAQVNKKAELEEVGVEEKSEEPGEERSQHIENRDEKETDSPPALKEQRVITFHTPIKQQNSESDEPIPTSDEKINSENKETLTKKNEENPQDHHLNTLIKRTSEIRKEAFTKATWDKNKVIGVWSPLHRIGVTSFIVTFAMFLANERSQVGVLEAPSKAYHLKQILERYKSIPDGWNSFARAMFDPTIPATSINYIYKGVQWILLAEGDHELEWNTDALYHYVNSTRVFDFVLIDLPTGEIGEMYRPLLGQLDELWIVVDDSYLQIKAWKQYMDQMIKEYNLSSYLIFNKAEAFSQQTQLSEDLELPLLAALPPLYQELAKNQYENKPILTYESVLEKLKEPYTHLSNHVLKSSDLTKHCSKYSLLGKWKRLFKRR
ncbi:hypothetical protein [Priestia koreensis]|uniref:hypothetical protein n=1 Tax=Priestia koreensis TaxID=284581 RepID=UPI001F578BCE|nr:hypothetical protein [Priestia koreensis]UNL87428.1 hypothetical protein IE339_24220 [Priestia koreensis]